MWARQAFVCLLLGSLAVFVTCLPLQKTTTLTVRFDRKDVRNPSSYTIHKGYDPSGAATAKFNASMLTTGWGTLVVESNPGYQDEVQMYAAGMVEGAATSQAIWDFWRNTAYDWGFDPNDNATFPPKLLKYLTSQLQWLYDQAYEYGGKSTYWQHVSLILRQMEGLADGYNKASPADQRLSLLDVYMLNAAGDLEDLIPALKDEPLSMFSKNMYEALLMTDCSGFIRVTAGKDICIGHTTWRSFGLMNRIFKWHQLPISNVASEMVMFSSSPGFLSSKDDFYITSAGLATLETTNSIFNKTLYELLNPATVPTWIRSILANRLGSNGDQWTKIFAQFNSGTYNNQWMVIDFNQWQTSSNGTDVLWILEQIPGYTRRADVTAKLLSQQYWPSYNIPFFKDIYNQSGYPSMVEKYGNSFDYDKCPRANIFRRDFSKVTTVEDMKQIMRYNDYLHDPFSQGNPAYAVAARYDLLPSPNAKAFGGIDSKALCFKQFQMTSEIYAISGPTAQSLPPFAWSNGSWPNSHFGQPNLFNFPYQTFSFNLNATKKFY